MFEGVYNSPYIQMPADKLHSRNMTLGQSIMNYVNNGDSYTPVTSNKNKETKENKKDKKPILKIVATTAVVLAGLVSAVLLIKKGGSALKNIKSPFKKINTGNLKAHFVSLKEAKPLDWIKNKGSKITEHFKKTK